MTESLPAFGNWGVGLQHRERELTHHLILHYRIGIQGLLRGAGEGWVRKQQRFWGGGSEREMSCSKTGRWEGTAEEKPYIMQPCIPVPANRHSSAVQEQTPPPHPWNLHLGESTPA